MNVNSLIQTKKYKFFQFIHTNLTFTCSNSTKETLEKDMKYFKVNNKNSRTTSLFLLLKFAKIQKYIKPNMGGVFRDSF